MFNAIYANDSAFFQSKLGFTPLMIQVVHPKVFDIVKVLLLPILTFLTEVSQSI
jgi:hypothetical protein